MNIFIPLQNPDIFNGSVTQYSVRRDSQDYSGVSYGPGLDEIMRPFSPKRRLDFLAGRHCAQKAFAASGYDSVPVIGIRPDGSPDWPHGWTGSITHTDGFASAAVTRTDKLSGLGIDSERVMSAEAANEIVEATLLPAEIQRWGEEFQDIMSFETYVTLIFSAKESVYKCLNPLYGIFLEFHNAEVLLPDVGNGTLDIRMRNNKVSIEVDDKIIRGKFSIESPYVHTAAGLFNKPADCHRPSSGTDIFSSCKSGILIFNGEYK